MTEPRRHWPTFAGILPYWTEGRTFDDALRACAADLVAALDPDDDFDPRRLLDREGQDW